jgi:hypothetical protein
MPLEQPDAPDQQRQTDEVAPAARADRRDRDRPDELDRDGRAQVDARDREVEGDVDERDRDPEGRGADEPPSRPVRLPGAPPGAQHDRREQRAKPRERRRLDGVKEQDRDAGARIPGQPAGHDEQLRRR